MQAPLSHFASPEFWYHYRQLPEEICALANKNFELLRADPRYPSLHFKKVGKYWSIRVGLRYSALAKQRPEGLLWFWIGRHDTYNELIRRKPDSTVAPIS